MLVWGGGWNRFVVRNFITPRMVDSRSRANAWGQQLGGFPRLTLQQQSKAR